MKRKLIKVFDNGGETFDRYTILVPAFKADNPFLQEVWTEVYTASGNPSHPQGFGQFAGIIPKGSYRPLDYERQVPLKQLPLSLRRYIRRIL